MNQEPPHSRQKKELAQHTLLSAHILTVTAEEWVPNRANFLLEKVPNIGFGLQIFFFGMIGKIPNEKNISANPNSSTICINSVGITTPQFPWIDISPFRHGGTIP